MGVMIGIDPTEIDSDDLHGVGVSGSPDGVNMYQYVKFNATTAAGQVVTIDGVYLAKLASTTESAPATGQGKPCGVARAAASANEFGWVQVCGTGEVNVAASCAAFTELNTTGTGGRLDDDATASAEVVEGIVLTATAGGAAGNTAALIAYPHVGRTL